MFKGFPSKVFKHQQWWHCFLPSYLQIPKQFKSASELQLYGEKIRTRQHALLNGNSSLSMKKWPRQLCPQHMIHHDTELPKEALRQNVLLIRQRMSQTNPSRLASLRPSYIITIKKWRTRFSSAAEAYITREAPKPHLSFVHLLIEVPTPVSRHMIWWVKSIPNNPNLKTFQGCSRFHLPLVAFITPYQGLQWCTL